MSLNIAIRIVDTFYAILKDIYYSIRKCKAKCIKKDKDKIKARPRINAQSSDQL
jgi:hypothetical protein